MVETTRALVMRSFLARYQELKEYLARRLGSRELASDAMHETWIRLRTRKEFAAVQNPAAYVFRAALNTALNLRLSDARRADHLEIEDILGVADDAPGPAVIAENRAEVAAVAAALAELTERQRIIFQESFLRGASNHELAARFGVGVRTIQIELNRAVTHCAQRLGYGDRFASGQSRVSKSKENEGSSQ